MTITKNEELKNLMDFYNYQVKPYGVSADREDKQYVAEEYERLTGKKADFIIW